MNTKFLKKSLSIVLAIAMLMTVCAVSFGASAALGSSVSWDFTDDATNADSLATLKANATFFGDTAEGYSDTYKIGTNTYDQYVRDTSTERLVINTNSTVNGFVLDGVTPTYLNAVVGEMGNYYVSWSRATPGLVFAKDSNDGYFEFVPYMLSDKGVRFFIRYIKNKGSFEYTQTGAYYHLADENDPQITSVTYSDDTTETLDSVKSSAIVPNDTSANTRLKYDIKANFEGTEKVTFSITAINNYLTTSTKLMYNNKVVKSYTFADFVLDLNNVDEHSTTQSGGATFSKRYKQLASKTFAAEDIDFVAGIAVTPQDTNKVGGVYSFEGKFGGGCAHEHTKEVVTKEATCLVAGTTATICEDCGKTIKEVSAKATHDNKCACLKLFPSVVINDGVIGVNLKAGMALTTASSVDPRWTMYMTIDDGVETLADENGQAYASDIPGWSNSQQNADKLVDGNYYFTKHFAGGESGETDIQKFSDELTETITVKVRYMPVNIDGDNNYRADGTKIARGESLAETEDGYLSKTFTFTIADLLKMTYVASDDDNVKEMALKTANYGAAAQEYFGHNHGEQLANYWVDDAENAPADNAYTLVGEGVASSTKDDKSVKTSATVQLKYKLGIAVAINKKDAEAVVTDKDGNKVEAEVTVAKNTSGAEIGTQVLITGITASQMGDTYTVVFTDGSGNSLATVKYSVNSYIARQGVKTTNTKLKTLVNAMAEFWNAAKAIVEA